MLAVCCVYYQMKAVLCVLLWSLVEVHSQPAVPYVSFMGDNLPNHSYVDLTLVGEDDTGTPHNTVRCNNDLGACCKKSQIHQGDWFFPNGSEMSHYTDGDHISIYRTRDAQRIILNRRHNAMGPSGIYRCDVATVAVHNDNDPSVRAMVYVGLYASGGIQMPSC